jgi:uncharacterized protein with von Willebrand factor type A (vWA) domain
VVALRGLENVCGLYFVVTTDVRASLAKRAERSGLLLSLVYRKGTCDISKSKRPFTNLFFAFLGAVRDRREQTKK